MLPILVFAFTIFKFVLSVQKESGKDRIHALEGSLHTVHALMVSLESKPNPKLRLTIHVLSPDKKNLIQALDYVGDQRKTKTAGRITPANCGIIGKALSEGKLACGSRKSENHET